MSTSVALIEVNAANVQKAYIAYFGRPADPAGLNFWTTAGTSGTTMLTIMRDFGSSAEFAALYGSGTNAAFVNAIYVNVFGRNADAEGLNFYVNALTNGSITRADVVFNVLNGASGADATIVANKVTFSTAYTDALATNVSAYVNYDSAFGIPQARTALAGVTAASTAEQISASVNTSITTVAAGQTPTPTTGNTYTFTTNIETFSGTAYADTFEGRVATSNGTFQAGDVVFGGSGSDTLTLAAQGGSAAVSLNSVESVNVRLIADTELDALNWSGTTSVSITNDSVDSKTLTIANAGPSTSYTVSDKDNLTVRYLDASGSGDSVAVVFNNAGTGVTLDVLNIETVGLGVTGVNTLTIEGSADLRTINVSGGGTLSIDTNDAAISAINLAGFNGSGTVNVSATSTLNFTGGGGNDTLTILGLTSADRLDGGEGRDTLLASLDDDTTRALSGVSNFEVASLSVSADVNTQVSGFLTVQFSYGTATTDFNISGINGTNLKFNVGTADTVTLGYTAGAADIDLVSSGGVSYGLTMITGAASVDLSVEGASTVAHTISSLRVELGDNLVMPESVAIRAKASASLTISELRVRDSDTLTLSASGAESTITVSDLVGSGLNTINLFAGGGGNSPSTVNITDSITVTGVSTTLNVVGTRSASIDADGFSAGNNAVVTVNVDLAGSAVFGAGGDFDIVALGSGTVDVNASGGTGAIIKLSTIDAGASGHASVSINLGSSGVAAVGAISGTTIDELSLSVGARGSATVGALYATSGLAAVVLNQAASGVISVGSANAANITSVYASGGVSSTISIGDLTGTSSIGAITLNAGQGSIFTVGSAALSNGGLGIISGTVGQSASVTVGDISVASGTMAGITFDSVASFADLAVGSATVAGATAGVVGAITISGGAEVDVAFGGVSARFGIGNISVVVGSSASFSAGVIQSVSAGIGAITLGAGSASVASASSLIAETSIGNITLNGSGTIDINVIEASASVGNISIEDDTTVSIASIDALAVGDITIVGDAANITTSANTHGDVIFTGSALTFAVAANATASFGDVRIDGVGAVSIDLGNATGVGEINTSGHSGSITLDLDQATGSLVVTLGGASSTNTVKVGSGTTLILTAGTAADIDKIYFGSTATDLAEIRNFTFASGTKMDVMQFASATFKLGMGSAATVVNNTNASALNLVTITGASAGVSFGSAANAATDVIFVAGTGFSGISDVFNSLKSAGSMFISAVGETTLTAGGQLLVMWYNTTERRTDLSLLELTASVTASELFSSTSSFDIELMATFSGQIANVTAANFTIGD